MGLKASKKGSGSKSDLPQQEALESGAYPARVVRIVDLGVQERRAFQGQPKKPAPHILITYELLDAYCLDDEGKELLESPRWITERFPVFSLDIDGAMSTKRMKALDPDNELDGDFAELLGKALMLTIVNNAGTGQHKGKVFNNVGGVGLMRKRDEDKAAELVNPTTLFDLDEPDMKVWDKLEGWLQKLIQEGVDFEHTTLAGMLDSPEKEEAGEEDDDGDNPHPKKASADEGDGDDW